MKPNNVPEARRTATPQTEWSGSGWTDSSWELARGLQVLEEPAPDTWPPEEPQPAQRPIQPTKGNP